MAKSRMREVEERFNKPLRDVLIDEFARRGSVMKVADALGVSQGTVSAWLMRCRLEIRSVIVDTSLEVQS